MNSIIKGRFSTATIYARDVEQTCIDQIQLAVDHPAFTNPIAIMPDTHAGNGSVIGFTMKVGDRIVPNTIGVDIGCGMYSVKLDALEYELCSVNMLKQLDHQIRRSIPMGFHLQKRPLDQDRFFSKACSIIGYDEEKARLALGSLGGGNHFIELGVGNDRKLWITIHSGSRNFGFQVCRYFQSLAKKHVLDHGITGIPGGMEFIEGNTADLYLQCMYIAQEYAERNREHMFRLIHDDINRLLGRTVNVDRSISSIHNFIDPQDNVLRKGACRSYSGESLIIPFNMRDGILVCEGRSNPEWNFSAPHGAGRVLSRSAAKKNLNLDEFKDQMKHIFSTSVVKETLDEAPGAYKDAKVIESLIGPTVDIVDRIRPILNVKAI